MGQKGRKKWQEDVYLEKHDLLKKTLIEATGALSTMEIYRKTGIARTTIDRHLSVLQNAELVQKFGKKYVWGEKYNVLIKGLKEDAALIEELDVLVNRQKEITNKMSRPENIERWREEGTYKPDTESIQRDHFNSKGLKELLEHKHKMFGELDNVFTDLAMILVKVKGHSDLMEDLSNVTIKFINRQPLFYVNGKFKEGKGAHYLPIELVEHEERLTKLAKKEQGYSPPEEPDISK